MCGTGSRAVWDRLLLRFRHGQPEEAQERQLLPAAAVDNSSAYPMAHIVHVQHQLWSCPGLICFVAAVARRYTRGSTRATASSYLPHRTVHTVQDRHQFSNYLKETCFKSVLTKSDTK